MMDKHINAEIFKAINKDKDKLEILSKQLILNNFNNY